MASKVSVITPVYNGERFINQYFSSLLQQTYNAVELIMVDDGSTDETLRMCKQRQAELEKKGWSVVILSQKNGGTASAVNTALKHVTGDYVMLFDIDDLLMPNNIAAKARFLDQFPEYGMVRNNGYMVSEDNMDDESVPLVDSEEEKANVWIFDDLVHGRTNNWSSTFMVRFSSFRSMNSGLNVHISQFGQNLQLMLPVAWMYKTGFIDEYLTKYVIYKKSHSHSDDPARLNDLRIGYLLNRLKIIEGLNMPRDEKNHYLRFLKRRICIERILGNIELHQAKSELVKNVKDCVSQGYYPIRTLLKAFWYVIG